MSIFETIKTKTSELTEKAGIPAILIYLALLGTLFSVWTGYLQEEITMAVGILLPAHMSMKALASETKDDDKVWLTYWVVFSGFLIAESLFGYVLKLLPFYFLGKLAFIIWLFVPVFGGAELVYSYLLKHVSRFLN